MEDNRPDPREVLKTIGPKGRIRKWLWWRWYYLRQWWNNPMNGFQIGRSISMIGKNHERPYLTYIKLLSPLPWRYAAELPPGPREISADPDAFLAAEYQTHDLRWVNVWKWHDTPM